MIDMLNIVKEKLELSSNLRKKINWASKYTSTSITLEKGTLIKLEPTNIAYVDPHKVIINDIKFLFFNGVDCFYINKDERLFRLIPITKDIDNPENVFNKFKLGIVTTSIKSFPCVDSNK